MSRDIKDTVTSSPQSQLRKNPKAYKTSEPLGLLEIPTRPWHRVHSDVIGPLPLTINGNKYIIVFVDGFSKFIVAEPIPDQKALTSINAFMNRLVARFGPPSVLVTDQGTNYMSDTFQNSLKAIHVTHRASTPIKVMAR